MSDGFHALQFVFLLDPNRKASAKQGGQGARRHLRGDGHCWGTDTRVVTLDKPTYLPKPVQRVQRLRSYGARAAVSFFPMTGGGAHRSPRARKAWPKAVKGATVLSDR